MKNEIMPLIRSMSNDANIMVFVSLYPFIILRSQSIVKQKCNFFAQKFKIGEIHKVSPLHPANF